MVFKPEEIRSRIKNVINTTSDNDLAVSEINNILAENENVIPPSSIINNELRDLAKQKLLFKVTNLFDNIAPKSWLSWGGRLSKKSKKSKKSRKQRQSQRNKRRSQRNRK